MSPGRRGCRAFTLVELLVVMGMLAGFMALILAGMRPTGGAQARQLAQLVSASFLTTQSKSFASPTGSALILSGSANGNAFACNAVYRADVASFIVGSCTDGVPPDPLSATTTTATLAPTNAAATALADGYKIRFYKDIGTFSAPSVWFAFNPANFEVRFDPAMSQTPDNTVWPVRYGAQLDFEIARYPRASALDFVPTPRAAIDLRHSGIGHQDKGLSNAGPSITFLFNRQGGLETMIGSGGQVAPTATVYLLVASLSDIEENENASLLSESSRWITISPTTGRVTVSPNVPSADLAKARSLARQGSTGGGP